MPKQLLEMKQHGLLCVLYSSSCTQLHAITLVAAQNCSEIFECHYEFQKEHEIISFFRMTFSQQANRSSYHDSSEETHSLAAGGAGRHITIAYCEEGNGYEPEGRVHVAGRLGGLPAGRESRTQAICSMHLSPTECP